MVFASSAFLAGLILLSVPWWLHRLNAHPTEQQPFASLFLMRPSAAPVNVRKQLQHLLLLALRWLLQQATVESVIVGVRTPTQLEDNLGSVGWSLTEDELAALDEASTMPEMYPYRMMELYGGR